MTEQPNKPASPSSYPESSSGNEPLEPPPLPPESDSSQNEGKDSETDESSSHSFEPPPLPPAETSNGQESPKSLLQMSKGFAGRLGAAAKSAGIFAANQAERTKLLNVTIPSQYTKLGKLVYESDVVRERDEFAELLAVIDSLHARAKALESQVKESSADE